MISITDGAGTDGRFCSLFTDIDSRLDAHGAGVEKGVLGPNHGIVGGHCARWNFWNGHLPFDFTEIKWTMDQ